MPIWIAVGIVVTGAAWLARRWRRRAMSVRSFSTEPLSGDWLAEARARDDQSGL